MRGLAGIWITCALALGVLAGCGGGGSSSTPTPTVAAPPPVATTPTQTTAKKGKHKKKGQPTTTTATTAAPNPLASEKQCGTILFKPLGKKVPVSAANLPCPQALSYATKLVSSDQPSQANLPPGWKLADCTGIGGTVSTPGEPTSPRCTHGNQAFTIHIGA